MYNTRRRLFFTFKVVAIEITAKKKNLSLMWILLSNSICVQSINTYLQKKHQGDSRSFVAWHEYNNIVVSGLFCHVRIIAELAVRRDVAVSRDSICVRQWVWDNWNEWSSELCCLCTNVSSLWKTLLHLSLSMYCIIHSALHYKTFLKEKMDGNKKKKT